MSREKSPLLEASESLRDYIKTSEQKRQRKLDEVAREHAKFEESLYFGTKEKNYNKKKAYSEYANNLKNELLGDVLKGIYIGALQENTALTDEGLGLAESLMENYIQERGGATALLGKMSGKTYCLDFIKGVVEGTYESIMEDTDEEDVEADKAVEDKDKEEMYNDLDGEEDIHKAVEIIAQRISDAEEEFIKKNKEDKETIENIATQVSDRIQKVEDEAPQSDEDTDTTSDEEEPAPTDDSSDEGEEKKDDTEETVEQESRIAKRATAAVRENRVRNVFEQVVLNLTNSIMKDQNLREQYTDEDGKLDMGSVVESAKCIYGLLETVNTLQLERVNSQYISEALSTM